MTIEAITFDLWGTVLWPRAPAVALTRRMELLLEAIVASGCACTLEALTDAWHASFAEAEIIVRKDLNDFGPPGRWRMLATRLGVDLDRVPYSAVESIYQDLTLEHPPEPMPGVLDVLRWLSESYRVGLICNTGVTGGPVLRKVLAVHGLFDFFGATVFSHEFGRLKPDPTIFHHTLDLLGGVAADRALHIGDMEDLDVDGAHAAGMASFLYLHPELQPPPDASRAHRVFQDWDSFPKLFLEWRSQRTDEVGPNSRS